MRALTFEPTIPRFLMTKALSTVYRPALWGNLSPLHYEEIQDPPLPGKEWVRIGVRLGGICGTDLHTIQLHASPALSALTSFPFVLGHENVGTVVELGRPGDGLTLGQRVTVEPVLPCAARGFVSPCVNCQAGNYNLCLRMTEGHLSPGMMIGACKDTGGSWGPNFVAHRSQVFPLPDDLSDENALMAEPMASVLHPILRHPPELGATVLVIGGGVNGQSAVAALRAMGSTARVVMLAKYAYQGTKATLLGADRSIPLGPGDSHVDAIAELTGGTLRRPMLGKRVLIGGVDLSIDCVGSSKSLEDALRLTRPGATVLVVGLTTFPRGIDWTPLWLKELHLVGSSFYSLEEWQGRRMRTMEIVLDWMSRHIVDIGSLVTHKFPFAAYPEALTTAMGKRESAAFKVAFVGERSS
jgi:threonine dehydrogenase-like Zn-dependent dehydrogenase